MRRLLCGLVLLSTPLLAGCEPTNLYVASHTVVGVNASVNTERTSGRLVVGYDRDFVTIIPKSVPIPDNEPGEGEEAMALLSCSELEVDGIYLTKFVESLASGEAARSFAAQLGDQGKADEIFNCTKAQ